MIKHWFAGDDCIHLSKTLSDRGIDDVVGFSQPFYGYKIIVETTTKSLGLFYLTEDHLLLKDLIFRLRDSRMNDPQIADYLSRNQISSKRNKTEWNGKDVWSVRKKFMERDKRSHHQTFNFADIKLITPMGVYDVDATKNDDVVLVD